MRVAELTLVLLLLATAGDPGEPRPPRQPFDAQGHRGARGLLPENTLPAFRRALELGVSTLELDTGITADGVVVVSHDRRLSSTICLGPEGDPLPAGTDPLIRDLTLEQLRRHDCGSLNPDPELFPEPPRRNLPGTPVPTLAEVFAMATGLDRGVRFNVEMKVDPTVDETVPLEEFVERLVSLIEEHDLVERTVVQCFDWRGLELVKRRRPDLATAALLSPETVGSGPPSPWLNGLGLSHAGGLGLRLVQAAPYVDILSPHWRQVTPGAWGYLGSEVSDYQAAGLPVIPWTVNSPQRIQQILDLGVDGLITDYPDRLLQILAARGIEVL